MPLKKSSGSVVEQASQFDSAAADLAAVTDKPLVTDEGNVSAASIVSDVAATNTAASTAAASDASSDSQAAAASGTASGSDAQATARTANLEADRHEAPATRQTEVAVRQEGQVAVASPASGMGQRMDELSKEGFEGLELGFGAFPTVVLNSEGQLQTGDGKLLGDHIVGTVDASKQKFLVKNTKCEKREEDFFYVFDQNWASNPNAVDSQGRNPHEKVAEWAGKGWGYEVKKYLDLCVILTTAATEASGVEVLSEGDMVLVQIPKTSISRFSGYAARAGLNALRSVPTRFAVGQKITGVDYPYYPWDFRKA